MKKSYKPAKYLTFPIRYRASSSPGTALVSGSNTWLHLFNMGLTAWPGPTG